MRVERKYSLNVKEVRLIKPRNERSTVNVRRPSASAAALCLPIRRREMRVCVRFRFSYDYRNAESTMRCLFITTYSQPLNVHILRVINATVNCKQFTSNCTQIINLVNVNEIEHIFNNNSFLIVFFVYK